MLRETLWRQLQFWQLLITTGAIGAAWHRVLGASYCETGPVPHWMLSSTEGVGSTIVSALVPPVASWEGCKLTDFQFPTFTTI